jgi:hypothetical protein
MTIKRATGQGPFDPSQLRTGDPYELSKGHAIYCAPTGGDGARRTGLAFQIIDSDPLVTGAGVDPGFDLGGQTMRAPDVAVGVPDAPGWAKGAPPLALEYAGRGQDEDDLQVKVRELLAAGTRWVWVVRLVGPRRVEVHTPDAEPEVLGLDAVLHAPGVLKNPVPVRALFDRDVAQELTLKNLLQRQGIEDLDAALTQSREEGKEEGREAGQRTLVERLVATRFGPLDETSRLRLATLDAAQLGLLAERLLTAPSLAEIWPESE